MGFLFILKKQKFSSVIVVFQSIVHFEDSLYNSDRQFKCFLIQGKKVCVCGEWRRSERTLSFTSAFSKSYSFWNSHH